MTNQINIPHFLPPQSIIGILGGGQLGRMLAIAAAQMGYHAHIYCPDAQSPASEVAKFNTIGEYDDIEALTKFAKNVDVITYEFENIPAVPISLIAKTTPVFPSPEILEISQHRVLEKKTINKLGVKTAPFVPVSTVMELREAIKNLGFPCILKTATMGYDGKGQAMIKSDSDIEIAFTKLCSTDLILEGFIPFQMEISVIVARDISGNIKSYCPVQNIHKNHILAETIAPASISSELIKKAEYIAHKLAEGLDLIGLIAVEMFIADDKIIVNEIAPRPHNSGHWTIEASITSQFEQVIRAVCGLPLGNPALLCDSKMINLIGDEAKDWQKYIVMENAKLHLYGKNEIKAGRKMGHVTILAIK